MKNESDQVKQEEYIQILQYCSDHMLQQVNDILDFNKIEAGKLELHPVKVNLSHLLLKTIKPFIALSIEKDVEIKVEVAPEIDVLVLADDLRLVQVFNNLFTNALKFTKSGFVILKAACKNINERGITVTFSVEDTGMGIDAADQDRIFESFWQVYDENTKELTGTGLGLSICVRLLKLMGSTLTLESEKGKGSKFIFDIEFNYAGKQPHNPTAEINGEGNLAGVNILLVEDNKINMMITKKILTGSEAIVTSAYDGKEALDTLAADAAFQLILLDLEMPVMNGYTAIYEIKKLYPHIPVVALTASLVDQQMLDDLLASGFNDCMLKPFQPHELIAAVQKSLSYSC